MYSIGIAGVILGVCVKTLRRWDKSKKDRESIRYIIFA